VTVEDTSSPPKMAPTVDEGTGGGEDVEGEDKMEAGTAEELKIVCTEGEEEDAGAVKLAKIPASDESSRL